jgi:hypothetical protein
MSASETRGCWSLSVSRRSLTLVELLSFAQDRTRRHQIHGFPQDLRRESFSQADLARGSRRRFVEGLFPGVELSPIHAANTVRRQDRSFIRGASENIPSPRHRAQTALGQQSIRFPRCNLTSKKKLDWPL